MQKQLQSLSENKDMLPEEMMEKRKELQQQIQNLNERISQRKMEIQQEKREATKPERQEAHQINTIKEDYAEIDTGTMQGLISADTSMRQVNTVRSTQTDMESRAGVLKREIEADRGRGGSVEKKEAGETDYSDVQVQKNNSYDKTVIYTKTGSANQQEP